MRKFPVNRSEYGGSSRKGRRKNQRPFDPKRPLHVVMKSLRAHGKWNFWRHKASIHLLVLDTAARYGIRIYRWENVGNHLHFALKAGTRRELQAFLRVLPQRVMFAVTGACKGNPVGKFFDEIAYSRIVNWGRDFKILLNYIWKNTLEALGFSRDEVRKMRQNAALVPL
jgi:hypothetical protein